MGFAAAFPRQYRGGSRGCRLYERNGNVTAVDGPHRQRGETETRRLGYYRRIDVELG